MIVAIVVGCGSGVGARPPSVADAPRAIAEPAPTPEPGPASVEEAFPDPEPDATELARGRTLVAPSSEGFLSTWRVEREESQVVATPSWRMQLGDMARRGRGEVTLAVDLLVPVSTHLFLMIGFRGAVSVSLGDTEIATSESQDRFRADHALMRVELSEGEHHLTLRFNKPERGAWRGAVRFLSARLRPGPGNVAIALGEMAPETAIQRAEESVAFDEHHELHVAGPAIRVRAHRPGGGVRIPIHVRMAPAATPSDAEPDSSVTEDDLVLNEDGVHAGYLEHTLAMPERGDADLIAQAGARSVQLGRRLAADRRALVAAAQLRTALAAATDRSRGPVAWRLEELLRAVREHDRDARWIRYLRNEAARITRDQARERDTFGAVRGYERMAFVSRIDGTAQEYELFVPRGYRPNGTNAWPLLVTLHGYKGNAGDYFRNTFGLARHPEEGETLAAHGRHGTAPTSGSMIVIGPTGRGQSFYRHAGEVDIFEAMADVEERFRIDPRRVYITGGSMGGTGAAYVPYRNPNVFAAAAALAGYHDQRIRSDTEHEGLSEAERFLTAHRSDVDWAENGLHLPMLLVRGVRDVPVEWTRVLVRRLDALGYRNEHREPELGHNVWTETYAEGAIFRWMRRYQRPENPAHVVLRTGRERTLESHWVKIEQREAVDRFAQVDATLAANVITAAIEGARAVTFSPVVDGPITVRVATGAGDTTREISGPVPLTIEAFEGGWRVSSRTWPEPGTRVAGVSGPIRDVYHEPLTFVVGTQDPDHTLINRLVARHWSEPKGWIVDYPVIDDTEVTDEMIAERTLVLIGPPSSNSVLARFADRLPIVIGDDSIRVGAETHRGPQVGAVFVAPNPLNPNRAVLVIAGSEPLGTWRSTHLPDILPDYVVFDESLEPARGRWACGGTGGAYRAHGFFDMRWRLPGAE